MLKIFYNEKSDAKLDVTIEIKGNYCRAEVIQKTEDAETKEVTVVAKGVDVIEDMLPYNSYALVEAEGSVKIYRQITSSAYRWLDLNRLGVAIKMDFANISQMYGKRNIVQLDTGIIAGERRDMVVRVFMGNKDSIHIDADQEYELLPFNSDDLILGDHPRMSLWDSYSLSACGCEFKANRKGFPIDGDFETVLAPTSGKDCIEFTIKKYRGCFESILSRDIDDEEVMVECSAGLCSNRRVRLQNGVGSFHLYPFGYSGTVKIKLGRKWYEVWNDYRLMLGER